MMNYEWLPGANPFRDQLSVETDEEIYDLRFTIYDLRFTIAEANPVSEG
jgi:hypothetical protein